MVLGRRGLQGMKENKMSLVRSVQRTIKGQVSEKQKIAIDVRFKLLKIVDGKEARTREHHR